MRILKLPLLQENDVVKARQRARQIAALSGFDKQEQTRIATAVSEIARNAFAYATGGSVEFAIEGTTIPQVMIVTVSNHGGGIADLPAIVEGRYQSPSDMDIGILGARRLMDQCDITTAPDQGTVIRLKKLLPRTAPLVTGKEIRHITDEVVRPQQYDPWEEVQQQNRELLATLAELRTRQDDLMRLNQELTDTNRGVLALYAELDEKADHLRRADELKTRFLSDMSHEFRTPVHSIQALTRLLLERIDGDLTSEQEKQVAFIKKAADNLGELIDDLLDLSKIEAGKVTVKPTSFEVRELFSSLRGMLRPLLVAKTVELNFVEPAEFPVIYSDERKISQILRNFLSNAIKFTEQGEIRVTANLTPEQDAVTFAVTDTGVGIAPEDQETIFAEFTQLDNPLQKRVKGTGLGLPLCRKLAALLGGQVAVESAVGVGSTFTATIPLRYHLVTVIGSSRDGVLPDLAPDRLPILIVEDDPQMLFLYDKYLRDTPFQGVLARSIYEAEQVLLRIRPRVIVLDIMLLGGDSWDFLVKMKTQVDGPAIPIVVITTVEDRHKGLALGADVYKVKPISAEWLVATLRALTSSDVQPRALVVDDDEMSRYLLKQLIDTTAWFVSEAATGLEGVRKAQEERPQVIFLDVNLPGLDGYSVLEQLRADPITRGIPVIVNSAKLFSRSEKEWLDARAATVIAKNELSRETVAALLDEVPRAAG
jgi:signal transduction histidine kinase/DNA-binding response OmpR family regulator